MVDKRYLFRGFHPDENGKTVIMLNGKKIRGKWVKGYYAPTYIAVKNKERIKTFAIVKDDEIGDLDYMMAESCGGTPATYTVLPETVGQWVTTDKNGKDVFKGDKIRILYTDWISKSEKDPRTLEQYLHDIAEVGEVVYAPYCFGVKIDESVCSLHCGKYGYIELIGNKWEVQNDFSRIYSDSDCDIYRRFCCGNVCPRGVVTMKPLTIDELKALQVGDWVWVESETYGNTYAVIEDSIQDGVLLSAISLFGWLNYSDYGKTWTAYKNKEQAETKGEWVELPCKIGDTIWVVYRDFDNGFNEYKIYEAKCVGFEFVNGTEIRIVTTFCCYDFDRIGNFTNKSEAEARLKELRGEK